MKKIETIFKELEQTDCGKYGHIWNSEYHPVRCVRCGYRTKCTLGSEINDKLP